MREVLALLLPRICVLCGDRAAEPFNLCTGCVLDLPRIAGACRRCGLPLPSSGLGICARCASAPPPFRRTLAAFRYADPLDTLIQQLKYQGDIAVAPTLGRLLAQRIAEEDPDGPECLLPVPLHPRRLRARGFNQSLEIAKAVGAGAGIPVKRYWVRRTRDTPVQSRAQSIRARRLNVRGAFTASRHLARYRRVAIIDDVVTTGATAAELARTILAQGVESVDLWCVARAEGSFGPTPGTTARREDQVSRLATASALDSMKSRRGPT